MRDYPDIHAEQHTIYFALYLPPLLVWSGGDAEACVRSKNLKSSSHTSFDESRDSQGRGFSFI
jgi:hypothetical protein